MEQSDTLALEQTDSLSMRPTDSVPIISSKKLSPNAVQSSIKYISQDSIIINLAKKKIILFEDAKAYYEDIELDAAFMEFGFVNNDLYASGIADSCGHIHGPPIFKQGGMEFCSQEIRYNFKSQKTKVTKAITNEGEGYIHGHYIKHVDEKTSYIKGGQYTTCNLEHPHFQIRFNKAKVIQDDKIVTGPAYMSFGDIPTPLAIPFGYFPLNKDRASGIIMPKYGEGAQRGFYFEDFGYYFGINDKIDLSLLGYITTRGSWGVKTRSNYALRYKFNGEVELGFTQNFFGEKGTQSWFNTNDFRVYWKHNQDPKSHPTTRFSAHIDVRTPTFNKYNPTSSTEYLSNQFNSSVNFSTNAKGIFFFDAGINYMQNLQSKDINVSLPDINMSVRQFYPFRKKYAAGKLKWYDNITLQWNSQMKNKIDTQDTLFFKPQPWQEMQSGIQHNIPLNIPIKVGKALNWNTSATLREKWYLQRNEKAFATDTIDGDVYSNRYDIFQRGFYALHDVSLSTSITTKMYWDYGFKKGGLKAIRHVMSPDASFSYIPNLSGNTYSTYFNTITGEDVEYSYFESALYGNVASRTQAIARFAINNNLEIKVRSKKDTITGTRKITIFDNVTVATSYDFAADSMRWRPLTINGRTSIFSFLDITFGFNFDPYTIGENGRRVNEREWVVNKRLMRFSGSNLNLGVNWRINRDFFKRKKKSDHENAQQAENNPRPDFTNPWNITINYTFAYLTSDNYDYYRFMANNKYTNNIVHTINVSADVNITRKWKVGVISHFDIQNKKFSYTKIDIYRDLHCWEMRLGWIPMGGQKGWNFQINVKASVLQDLKYKIENDFRDNY